MRSPGFHKKNSARAGVREIRRPDAGAGRFLIAARLSAIIPEGAISGENRYDLKDPAGA
jgi:hypothetical protein